MRITYNKNIRSLFVAISSLFFLSNSILLHANIPGSNSSNLQVTTVQVTDSISLKDFALRQGISLDKLMTLNGYTSQVTLPKGTSVKIPAKNNEVVNLPELTSNSLTITQNEKNNSLLDGTLFSENLNLEKEIAEVAKTAGSKQNIDKQFTTEQIEHIKNNAVANTNRLINQNVNGLLGKFGTVETNISVNDKGELVNSDIGIFSPLHDTQEHLFFSQTALRSQSDDGYDRTVGNLGLGYRYNTDSYLLGANVFLDHDFTRSNTRLGLGTEYWIDYAKFSSNFYTPISSWKNSEQLKEHDERPATGFDIRGEAFLKSHPQLGGTLVYEQYFGDEVGLFGVKNRTKDPYALSAGINYSPFPLLKSAVSHKIGRGGNSETRFDVTMNLRMGVPLEEQIKPENIVSTRSLMGSRYDLVNRNNEIIFEYRKQIFEVIIKPTKYKNINDPSKYIYNLDELVDFEATHTSQSKIVSHRWSINPTEIEINGKYNYTTFKPSRIGSYSVRLELTNENGITAYSKPVVIKVKSPEIIDKKILINFINRTNGYPLFDFDDNGELSNKDNLGDVDNAPDRAIIVPNLSKINNSAPYNHYLIHFTVTYEDSNELNYRPVIHYDTNGITDKLGANIDKLILVSDYRDIEKTNVWHFVVASTNPDVYEASFFAEIDTSFSNTEIMFFDTDEPAPIIDKEIFRITLQEMGVNGNQPGAIVLDTNPMNPISNEIKNDTYYKTSVYQAVNVTNGNFDWVDITPEVQHSLVWRYYNPNDNSKDADISTQLNDSTDSGYYYGLEQCRGYTNFSTQVNNFKNNEMSWGKIGQSALIKVTEKYQAGVDILTEQGYELAVQFDRSTRIKGKIQLDSSKIICTDQVPASDEYYQYLMQIANTQPIKG